MVVTGISVLGVVNVTTVTATSSSMTPAGGPDIAVAQKIFEAQAAKLAG